MEEIVEIPSDISCMQVNECEREKSERRVGENR
jgi:hypothetical protein